MCVSCVLQQNYPKYQDYETITNICMAVYMAVFQGIVSKLEIPVDKIKTHPKKMLSG